MHASGGIDEVQIERRVVEIRIDQIDRPIERELRGLAASGGLQSASAQPIEKGHASDRRMEMRKAKVGSRKSSQPIVRTSTRVNCSAS